MAEEEMGKTDGCDDTDKLGTLDSSEKTVAISGDGVGQGRPKRKEIIDKQT